MSEQKYMIGVDYGTDSVRAVIVGAEKGNILASSVSYYKRWKEGKYCKPSENQFRQHPKDYLESLEIVVRESLKKVTKEIRKQISALSVATTGSTPVAVDEKGRPLALLDSFRKNPNAMFILWKDHTAASEAEEINKTEKDSEKRYLKYVGGSYSPEWYWAKLLHLLRTDNEVREQTYTFVEHSDWIPFVLTGGRKATEIKRNVCAAGHKALWADEFDGLPPLSFYHKVDPVLTKYVSRYGKKVFSADQPAGTLSKEWADRLGLPTQVKVGIGAIDAHIGAVGGGIEPYFMSKVIGTSTCDMMVIPKGHLKNKVIEGISGQVKDSILPGMIGLEAGQSAFGDIYSWFRDLLLWSVSQNKNRKTSSSVDLKENQLKEDLLKELDRQAAALPLKEDSAFALDWFNGRRTPFVNPNVKGLIGNLTLGTTPPQIYRALVEATCFGSRAIIDSMEAQGIKIQGVNAIGGIAKKSQYVIQTLANILQRPIRLLAVEQSVAIGAAMFAAVVSGCYNDVEEAGRKMMQGEGSTISPEKKYEDFYDRRYDLYKRYGTYQQQ